MVSISNTIRNSTCQLLTFHGPHFLRDPGTTKGLNSSIHMSRFHILLSSRLLAEDAPDGFPFSKIAAAFPFLIFNPDFSSFHPIACHPHGQQHFKLKTCDWTSIGTINFATSTPMRRRDTYLWAKAKEQKASPRKAAAAISHIVNTKRRSPAIDERSAKASPIWPKE